MGAMRTSALTVLALALCAILVGCGDDSVSKEQAEADFGVDLGAPINLADCTDWNAGDVNQRLGTIRELKNFLGGPTGSPGGHGATLEDEDAYDLFERFCEHEYARGFKLYKLYSRSAAFGGPSP